jgi:hypothetical protein
LLLMPTWLKALLGGLFGLLGLLVAAALILPVVIDRESLRAELEAELSRAVAGQATIQSISALRLLPKPSIALQAVRLVMHPAPGQGVRSALEIRMERLKLQVRLTPLLRGQIALGDVLIDRPEVMLPVQKDRRTSHSGRNAPSTNLRHLNQGQVPALAAHDADVQRINLPRGTPTTGQVPAQTVQSVHSAQSAQINLPPVARLRVRDGALVQPATQGEPGWQLRDLELTATPVAPGQTGALRGSFLLQAASLSTPVPGQFEAELRLPVAFGDPALVAALPDQVSNDTADQAGGSAGGRQADPNQATRSEPPRAGQRAPQPVAYRQVPPREVLPSEILLSNTRLHLGKSPMGQHEHQPGQQQTHPREALALSADLRIRMATQQMLIESFKLEAKPLQLMGDAVWSWAAIGSPLRGQMQMAPVDVRAWSQAWLKQPLPGPVSSFRWASAVLDFQLHEAGLALDDIRLTLDQSSGAGWARLRWQAEAPAQVRATTWPSGQIALALDQLSFDPVPTSQTPSAGPGLDGSGDATAVAVAHNARLQTEGPFAQLRQRLPKPHLASMGTSDPAGAPELQLRVWAEEVALAGLRLNRLDSNARLERSRANNGTLRVDARAELYGGALQTLFSAPFPLPFRMPARAGIGPPQAASVDGTAPGTQAPVSLDAKANEIDLGALLLALGGSTGGVPAMTGQIEAQLQLQAPTLDPPALIKGLGGRVAVVLREGQVSLADLDRLVSGTFGAFGATPQDIKQLTRYHSAAFTAQGQDGIFKSDNIQVQADLLRIDGGGRVELPTQALALDLQAVMVESPSGGGIRELEGIPFPITAQGHWSDPQWEVDLNRALQAAARRELDRDDGLLDQLEERTGIKGLGESVRQLLPGLLGP